MKRIVALFLLALLVAFSGCTGSSVKTLSKDDMNIAKIITSDVTVAYETNGNAYGEWFVLDRATLLTDLNSAASQKSYPSLWEMKPRMFTFNGDAWFILATSQDNPTEDGFNCITKIELSLFNDGTVERQTRNGDYIYFLINLFTPGMAEKIADELSVFAEDQKTLPPIRQIVCGNVVYRFKYDESLSPSFYVLPARNPKFDEPASSAPFALKPQ